MPYCPQCKREIDDDTVVCPECKTQLTMGSSVESSVDDDTADAVLLLKADSSLQAELLVAALDEEGIPYLAKGLGITDGLGGVGGGDVLSGAFSSPHAVEIWVNPSDLPRAKEVLVEQTGAELEEDETTEEGGESTGESSR
jgi:hypothetical protein